MTSRRVRTGSRLRLTAAPVSPARRPGITSSAWIQSPRAVVGEDAWMRHYSEEWVDGRRVDPLVLNEDATISEHRGSIIVRPGVSVRVAGSHQGSLTLESGASGVIAGQHQGSVRVQNGATLTIESRQQGSLHIATGGVATITRTGTSQGSVHVDGVLINEGARGGSESGSGEIRDMPGCRVVQPIKRGDAIYYEW